MPAMPGWPGPSVQIPTSVYGEEPVALRAREHSYDPFAQVHARLEQFELLGHRVDKVELIVMGGTMTARAPEYQEQFVSSCIEAMNTYPGGTAAAVPQSVAALQSDNETSGIRCVAITFETRPDWCRREHVDRMLTLGVTKVELGAQHTDDRILTYNRRGCSVADTVDANTLLRDAGMKVGFHMMPNLPGFSIDLDKKMFETLFSDPRFHAGFSQNLPYSCHPRLEIEEHWKRGDYHPYNEEDMIDLVAYAKSLIPEYTRLQRIQRDIPAKLIVAGSRYSNFRQLAQNRLKATGRRCRCIRCREIGRLPSLAESEIRVLNNESCGGQEHFISAVSDDSIIGFARLRFPSRVYCAELENAAVLRELHVYGSLVPVGKDAETEEWQHRNFGKVLLARAEEIAIDAGFTCLAVMSGIGVRPYYRRQGYERRGTYMIRDLS